MLNQKFAVSFIMLLLSGAAASCWPGRLAVCGQESVVCDTQRQSAHPGRTPAASKGEVVRWLDCKNDQAVTRFGVRSLRWQAAPCLLLNI